MRCVFPVMIVAGLIGAGGLAAADWEALPNPEVTGSGAGTFDYRCWVKVPDRWVTKGGRSLWSDSVTLSFRSAADAHEVRVNGKKVGGSGRREGVDGFRYKVPPGVLVKGIWNEIAIRAINKEAGAGHFSGPATIRGYFLECFLEGAWEMRKGGGEVWGGALTEKPARAAYEQFAEASGVMAEAPELMPGERLPPDETMARMRPGKDLEIDLLLAEPEVAQPTHLSFDARGRLWVSEYRQYPYPSGLKMISRDRYYRAKYDQWPKAPPDHNRGRSRITVHEDKDGDGTYETHRVFIDGLDLANSALPGEGGVWVMHTPYLLFYPDGDGDDVPDGDPEVHLSGFGFEDTHSVANGLVWGPDGWIYGGQGSTVTARVVRPGIDPPDAPGVYHEGCMVWRYHPARREFEIFAEGGGNVFGLEFDSEGRLFSGHNGGDTRGWHYVQHGLLLKQGRAANKYGPPGNPFAFGDLPMMRGGKISRFSHNTILCEGTALPARMAGRFLAADPLHHYLVLSERKVRGSTFETVDLGFPLRCEDEGFRPVYLTNAPDGSVYIADFYEQFIAHGQHYQSQIDPSTGRVYRLRGKAEKLLAETDLAGKQAGELIALLDHPNKWHRQMAVHLLGRRKDDSKTAEALAGIVLEERGRKALGALWALHQMGHFHDGTAEKTLGHPDVAIRIWSVRLLGDRRLLSDGIAAQLVALAEKDAELEVWSQLASTAQRLASGQAMAVMSALLRRAGDLEDVYLPLMFWWAIEKHCDEGRGDVLKAFGDGEIWQQPTVATEIIPRLMRRFAAQGREKDLVTCAKLLRMAPSAEGRDALMSGFELAFQGGAVSALPPELTEAMEETGVSSVALRIRRRDGEAIKEAVRTIGDAKAHGQDRLLYVRLLGEIAEPTALEGLLGIVTKEEEPDLVLAAIRALQKFSDPRVGRVVASAYPRFDAASKKAAQLLLASRPSWAMAWLTAMDRGEIKIGAGEISREAVATVRLHESDEIGALAAKHFGAPDRRVNRDSAKRIAEVRAIVSAAPGSPYRGRELYKQRCAACHRLFHTGGNIGPDLTSYQRDDLGTMLTSVIDPNVEIREGFEGYVIKTKDGRTLSGFLVDDGLRTVTIRGFDGGNLVVEREGIGSMDPLGRSLMPPGLLDGLEAGQIRDLFAYLRISQPISTK